MQVWPSRQHAYIPKVHHCGANLAAMRISPLAWFCRIAHPRTTSLSASPSVCLPQTSDRVPAFAFPSFSIFSAFFRSVMPMSRDRSVTGELVCGTAAILISTCMWSPFCTNCQSSLLTPPKWAIQYKQPVALSNDPQYGACQRNSAGHLSLCRFADVPGLPETAKPRRFCDAVSGISHMRRRTHQTAVTATVSRADLP